MNQLFEFSFRLAPGTSGRFDEDIHALPIERWEDYVEAVWPRQSDSLPSVAELTEVMDKGAIFFGPPATFSH